MAHAEYLAEFKGGRSSWLVRNFRQAIFEVYGREGSRKAWLVTGIILLPSAFYAVYAVATRHWAALVWPLLALPAFRTGRSDTALSGGCLWFLAFFVGLGLSIRFGIHHIFGGVLAILTYFAAGLFKMTIFNSIGDLLCTSPEAFDRLVAKGLLIHLDKSQEGVEAP